MTMRYRGCDRCGSLSHVEARCLEKKKLKAKCNPQRVCVICSSETPSQHHPHCNIDCALRTCP